MDVKSWKQLTGLEETWKQFRSHFTKAINNDNKSDTTWTLRAIGIANAVEEQVDQNKENQRILAQATVEANDKIDQLEKQTAQLYAALMVKQPPQQQPLQDTTAATIKALEKEPEVEEKDAVNTEH